MKKKTRILSTLILCLSIVSWFGAFSQEQTTPNGSALRLDLKTALQIAHDNNPTLKIANLEIQRVNYAKKEAIGNLLPNVSASGQYTNNLMKTVMFMPASMSAAFGGKSYMEVGYKNSYSGTVSASLPLVNFSLWEQIKAKQTEIQSIIEQSRASNIDMTKQVRDAYFNVLLANSSVKVLKQGIDNAQEALKSTKVAYENGAGSEFDYLRAQVQVNSLNPQYLSAQNSAELAMLQLKMLLSLPQNQDIEIIEKLEDYEQNLTLLDGYNSNRDFVNNTELRQLDLQMKSMQHNLKLTKYQHLPTLSAMGNYTYQTQAEDFKFKDYNWVSSASVGLQLSIPIFAGNTVINKTKQLELSLKELQLQRDYLVDGTNLQVQSALNKMQTAKDQLVVNKESINQAERAYQIAKVRYQTGSGTILELNDSELALTQAHLNYQQSIYDYMNAQTEYEKTMGQY